MLFLAFHFVNPLINFKTGLLTTPHFAALATSQLFTMENTIATKFDESQMLHEPFHITYETYEFC